MLIALSLSVCAPSHPPIALPLLSVQLPNCLGLGPTAAVLTPCPTIVALITSVRVQSLSLPVRQHQPGQATLQQTSDSLDFQPSSSACVLVFYLSTSTGSIPYSLGYGMGAVTLVEVKIHSLCILKESGIEEFEWDMICYEMLNMINEKRLTTICHNQLY